MLVPMDQPPGQAGDAQQHEEGSHSSRHAACTMEAYSQEVRLLVQAMMLQRPYFSSLVEQMLMHTADRLPEKAQMASHPA